MSAGDYPLAFANQLYAAASRDALIAALRRERDRATDELRRAQDEIDLLRVQLDITTRLLREVWAYGNMSPLDGGTMNRIGNYLGLNE